MQQGWIRTHQSDLAAVYRLLDGALILGALLACTLVGGISLDKDWLIAGLTAVILFAFIGESLELYRSWRTESFRNMLLTTALAWAVVCLLLLLIGYFSAHADMYSRIVVGSWFCLTLIGLGLWRLALRQLLHYLRVNDHNTRSAAILGFNQAAVNLAEELQRNPQLGIRLQGIYRLPGHDGDTVATENSNLLAGDLEQALSAAKAGDLDLIYIALPMGEARHIGELLAALGDTTATVYLLPDIFGSNLLRTRWQRIGGSTVLSIYDSPIQGINSWLKRLEDLLVSTLALALLSPLMLFIALGVKLTSPGPVLFKQRRYGLNGHTIDVWKFRSMTCTEDGPSIQQVQKNDARVTPLGRFIRCTSLDELPQLFNVLGGTMSIVGPRPHAVAHNEQFRSIVSGYMLRHKVKPGITGWAQINGWRGETDTLEKMHKRVEHDLDYIRNWSIFLDLRILCLTVSRGFVGKNAY
ncbi:undecaprenyl-phosphate glucose phosphotransferase [Microbulbifer agarilyticus]|uniref:undecaprenyl-phosphate glucose phosphotransferase n=1 Tax=Microbulbifer agarilyticus TaxID=260552 RepID=UPI001C9458AD|nr:undecaprenyl-phosphate glucose phosphotransferase [Microbulbifer agarilyticus]MBY6191797.1 undecaprenyl-phosphate glucose phosphotransferase [Microbulbifer agarilyticus]MBY6212899.1 undecaprenyl-phosphate glucose phosphotransferase [Microbulbifer agarilyticus]MCA0894470.1 undecaprenyl-phosphate glucose phosphotransferase [Microbulbifer agarilyticus]